MPKFNVTFEIVTPESAEFGDAADRGFLVQDVSFRDAMERLGADGCHVEADCCPVENPSWFTAYSETDGDENQESRSLHLPNSLTESSRLRIARLLDCYGLR